MSKWASGSIAFLVMWLGSTANGQPTAAPRDREPVSDPPTYDLHRLPTWTVGDRLGMGWDYERTISMHGGGGRARMNWRCRVRTMSLAEVLSTDSNGHAASVRIYLQTASKEVRQATHKGEGNSECHIGDVFFEVRRHVRQTSDGPVGYYRAEPDSIHIIGDGGMSLPQLCLLRKIVLSDSPFGLCSETGTHRAMFSQRPVIRGETWTTSAPTPGCLDEYARHRLTGTPIDLRQRTVTLTDVDGNMAEIAASVSGQWQDPNAGQQFGKAADVWRMDTESGRLLHWSHTFSTGVNGGIRAMMLGESSTFSARFRPGEGHATTLSCRKLTFVGWTDRGETDNTVRRKGEYSLTPPEGMRSGLPDESGIVRWDGRNATLRIGGLAQMKNPSYRTAHGFVVAMLDRIYDDPCRPEQAKKIFLPGRLPCIQYSVRSEKKKRDIVALVAISHSYYFCIVAEYPKGNAALSREIHAALQSFRDL